MSSETQAQAGRRDHRDGGKDRTRAAVFFPTRDRLQSGGADFDDTRPASGDYIRRSSRWTRAKARVLAVTNDYSGAVAFGLRRQSRRRGIVGVRKKTVARSSRAHTARNTRLRDYPAFGRRKSSGWAPQTGGVLLDAARVAPKTTRETVGRRGIDAHGRAKMNQAAFCKGNAPQ
jgi:hypothetical protein